MTSDEVQEIIDEVDENGDGKLDFKEVTTLSYQTIINDFSYNQ